MMGDEQKQALIILFCLCLCIGWFRILYSVEGKKQNKTVVRVLYILMLVTGVPPLSMLLIKGIMG